MANNGSKENKEGWKLILFIVLTIPFLDSTFTNSIPILDRVNSGLKLLSAFAILYLYIMRKKPLSKLDLLIFGFELYLLIVTIWQGADVRRAIGTVLPIVAVTMLYEVGLDEEKAFIKSQYICFSILIYANLAAELLYPNGMFVAPLTGYTQNWILGYYNNHSLYFMMAICMTLLYAHIWQKHIGPALLIAAIYASALIVKSGGVLAALAGTAIGLAMFVLNRRTLRYALCWALPLIFAGFILLQHSSAVIEAIWHVSQDLFDKGGSFYARLDLWQRAIYFISQNPIFGHGIESQQQRLFEYAWGLHAHNLILELLHQGGIVGFVLFSSIVAEAGRKVRLVRGNRLYMCIIAAIIGWTIQSFVEPFMSSFLIALFVVSYRAPEIELSVTAADRTVADIDVQPEERAIDDPSLYGDAHRTRYRDDACGRLGCMHYKGVKTYVG